MKTNVIMEQEPEEENDSDDAATIVATQSHPNIVADEESITEAVHDEEMTERSQTFAKSAVWQAEEQAFWEYTAAARLRITVESARHLHDPTEPSGRLDTHVSVEVRGQPRSRFQTRTISNEQRPVWNSIGTIVGVMDGDILSFTVKNHDFNIGQAELTAQDFYPNGFQQEITLAGSDNHATLKVRVEVTGCEHVTSDTLELAQWAP